MESKGAAPYVLLSQEGTVPAVFDVEEPGSNFWRNKRKRNSLLILGAVAMLAVIATIVIIGVTVGVAVGVTQSQGGDGDSSSSSTNSQQQEKDFQAWMANNGKQYGTKVEYNTRFGIWTKNSDFVKKTNGKGLSFKVSMNKFADLSTDEVTSMLNGAVVPKNKRQVETVADEVASPNEKKADFAFSWVTQGRVAPVEDQGQCGCCWAFGAAGALTSALAIARNSAPVQMSEQYLIDCSTTYPNDGCGGGWPDTAFASVQASGIPTENGYTAFSASGPNTCDAPNGGCPGGMRISGYTDVTSGSESALLTAVETVGPITVGINAGLQSFQMYTSGIYDDPDCDSYSIDHAVLVVGAGTLNGQDYWLVKNSWSTEWGDNGYIMMARNAGNLCGIASYASYPTGAAAC